MKRKLLALLTALVCVVLLARTACAAEPATVRIPVTIHLDGTLPSTPEKFTITLKADEDTFPMPADAKDGGYTMVIRGAGARSFSIAFDRVGIYTYTIRQEKGDDPKCTYDMDEYEVKICITNGRDGKLAITASVCDENGEKVPDIEFDNRYRFEPNAPPRTDDESNFSLYFTLAAGSILVLAVLYWTREREE